MIKYIKDALQRVKPSCTQAGNDFAYVNLNSKSLSDSNESDVLNSMTIFWMNYVKIYTTVSWLSPITSKYILYKWQFTLIYEFMGLLISINVSIYPNLRSRSLRSRSLLFNRRSGISILQTIPPYWLKPVWNNMLYHCRRRALLISWIQWFTFI